MQSLTVMEAGQEVLQVLEVCETVEEIKEVIVTTTEDDPVTNLPPVASSGPETKSSQVKQLCDDGTVFLPFKAVLHKNVSLSFGSITLSVSNTTVTNRNHRVL